MVSGADRVQITRAETSLLNLSAWITVLAVGPAIGSIPSLCRLSPSFTSVPEKVLGAWTFTSVPEKVLGAWTTSSTSQVALGARLGRLQVMTSPASVWGRVAV